MKKLLAILLAASMLFAFAACGGNTEDETTTEPTTMEDIFAEDIIDHGDHTHLAGEEIVHDTTAAVEDTTAAAVEDTTAAATEETTLAAEETTTAAAPAADMTKAEFVAFLNAETAKAAKGSYKFNRNCQYTRDISLGSKMAESAINGVISAIDENSNLNTVVGGFLGIGTKTGTYPKDGLDDNYKLKATTLTEADIQNFTAKGDGTYQFTLASASNPKKTNATPISRFTNDFITHEEVVKGIADFTEAITVNSTDVTYENIKVAVTVADGKITSVKYSYDFDATIVLKVGFEITGTGAAKTVGQYTDIKY